jgi:hypothetical protein
MAEVAPSSAVFGDIVTAVDVVITDRATEVAPEFGFARDRAWFGGRVLGTPVLLFTDFEPDAHGHGATSCTATTARR